MLARVNPFDRFALVALSLYILSVGLVWTSRGVEKAQAQDPVSVESPAPPKKLNGPVSLSFDIKKLDKDVADVYSVCAIPAPQAGEEPAWKGWVGFEGKRLKSSSSQPAASVYAVKTLDGVSLCVTNPTEDTAEVRMNASIPRGVYNIERIVLDLERSESSETMRPVERMSGSILGEAATLKKTSTVPPNSLSIYRWVNRTQQALNAFKGAKQYIKSLRGKYGSQYRWLMVPFGECESNIAVIDRGISSSNKHRVLKHVHRAILTAAHTEALSRNFTSQGRIPTQAGEGLTAKLSALDEALSELSLACLGLKPDTVVELSEGSGEHRITVSVTNSGSQTINFVKVGALSASGIRMAPEELATFSSLRPGETARSVQTVRCKTPQALSGLTAHVGYLAGKSPVRLKIRPII